ncbi:MAG TPA: hypothetical protein VFA04_26755, partial [Bryobacteraceae bacterium]|nr:hypothetical protein [Bryobacteraceae bacterium]
MNRIPRSFAAVAVCAGLLLSVQAANGATASDISPQTPAPTDPSPLQVSMVRAPLSFERNLGQSQSPVEFLAHGAGFSLELERAAVRLRFGRENERSLTAEVLNAAGDVRVEGENLLPGKVNYFPARSRETWVTGVPTYERVLYKGLYPGVDSIFYGNPSRLEYDFRVQAGADARQVRLRLSGMDDSRLDSNGDLALRLGNEELRILKPVAYQISNDGARRDQVEARYQIERGEAGAPIILAFDLGNYDHRRPLVIDPVVVPALSFSEYLPNAFVSAIAADNSGNSYVAGYYNVSSGMYVTKLNATGGVLFTTIVGTGTVVPLRLALDGSANIYVAGYLQNSATLPTSANAY